MNASMPWVKLYTEMLDDPKIGRLPDEKKWRFVQLVLYAGELDKEGYLPDNLEDAAWRLRIDLETLHKDLETLKKFNLAHQDENGNWCITAFSKRQGRSQSEKREQWREYQKTSRAKSENNDSECQGSVINDTEMSHSSVYTPEESREEESREDSLAPVGAIELPENSPFVKNKAGFHALEGYEAHKARGDPDLAWLPEHLMPYAERFIQATNVYPLKSEHKRWIKDFEAFSDSGISPPAITKAATKMRQDGLTIKSPASLFGIARDIEAKKGDDHEVCWESH